MKRFILYGLVFLLPTFFYSQVKRETINIPYSNNKIKVDGNLKDWEIYYENYFADTLHSFISKTKYKLNNIYPHNFDFNKLLQPKSRNRARFRAFWNNTDLCCAVTVWDKHFFAEVHGRIDKPMVHLNDGVELYFDTGNNATAKMDINDYQFLVDIENNTEVFKGDLKEILADTVAVPKDFAQNVLFYHAIKKTGIPNDTLTDSVYTIEFAIPFAAIGIVPHSGMKIGIDVCVNDFDYPSSKTYRKEEVSTGMHPFSWNGYSDFGYPQYWKEATLIGAPSWFESVSDKYRSKWFEIYLFTVIFSLIVIGWLFYKTYKLRKLPTVSEFGLYKKFIETEKLDKPTYNQKIIDKAADYIVKNKGLSFTSENLAEFLGISLRTFQRITKEELNTTPTNYIHLMKLQLAASFLKNKTGNVTDAAYEFGFSDPSYFSKIFKKHFGLSPSEYIKNNNNYS
jgi:AraC-like DNA-binding protein